MKLHDYLIIPYLHNAVGKVVAINPDQTVNLQTYDGLLMNVDPTGFRVAEFN